MEYGFSLSTDITIASVTSSAIVSSSVETNTTLDMSLGSLGDNINAQDLSVGPGIDTAKQESEELFRRKRRINKSKIMEQKYAVEKRMTSENIRL